MQFFLLADDLTVNFGLAPEGATIIDPDGVAPFAGRRFTIAAIEETSRTHLRWLRWQDGRRRAVLTGADLTDAVLTGAVLTGADLTDAVLTRADLTDAVLTGAVLTDAVLTDAVLTDADLTGAVLTGAVLTGADLTGAVLTAIRDDVCAVLTVVPNEAPAVLTALREGRINGTLYRDAADRCGCLVGTIAMARGCTENEIPGLLPNSNRPAERWFTAILPGNTPENHVITAITAGWIEEWIAAHPAAPSL